MSLAGNDANLPTRDDLEISLFGPGYGESILVYTGEGDWLVIDSCVTTDRKTPAVLAYLGSIGVDPSTAVKLVVATHWHDDHIRGLAALYQACTSAKLVCSQALKNEDFLTLSVAASDRAMMETSGVNEFNAVLAELSKRGDVPRWALADRVLWRREGAIPCRVWALSPSDRAIAQAFQSVGQLLDGGGSPKRRIPAPERNHGAVAILLNVGSTSALFGADLETTDAQDMGWAAVLASPNRPTSKAKIYKVAHHGAASADCPQIWTDLLRDQPVAILTPFSRGKVHLPTDRDIQRMKERTSYVYATAHVASKRSGRGSGSVAKTKREVLRNCRKLVSTQGQVRVRMNIHESRGRVDLFGSAVAPGTASAGNVT
jgi:beta-lactamase superfamily II metal-dependent hydrolase